MVFIIILSSCFFCTNIKDANKDLFKAIGMNNLNGVKKALSRGADIEAKEWRNCTPLLRACGLGRINIVKFLIDKGANVFEKNTLGQTTLMLATEDVSKFSKNFYCSNLRNGAKCSLSNTVFASDLDRFKIVNILINKGVDINAIAIDGSTALMSAVFNEKMVVFLIENGADVNAITDNGTTALTIASSHGRFDTVKKLVDNGADIYHKTKDGCTALNIVNRKIEESDFGRVVSLLDSTTNLKVVETLIKLSSK
jgi:ankyrin repeat protein